MGMKEPMFHAMIAVSHLGTVTHSEFLFQDLAVSRSMRTLVVMSRSARSAMREMAHAATSTPARMFSPSDVALTMFASNRRPWSCQWRGSTVLNLVNLIKTCKSLKLV